MLSKSFQSAVLFITLCVGAAQGSTITASLFTALPPSGTTPVIVDLTGVTAPSQATLTGVGYTVSFSGIAANQGVVNGNLGGIHAVPVAGVSGPSPEYLTGNFGSALTTNIASAGNYLSTGLGTITINFTSPQSSLALLWGSIDTGNSLSFNDSGNFTVSGSAVQAAAAGFVSNGFQGPGGSAYVVVNTTTPFTRVTATSSVVSFEFEAIAASTVPFSTPEPASLMLVGAGMLLVGGYRRRTKKENC
jgi:hypothetical protein